MLKLYLQERQQSLCVENCHYEFVDVSAGGPQESVLGPHLFSLYIIDDPWYYQSVIATCLLMLYKFINISA